MKLGGIEEAEMGRTFNCGIGMVVVVPEAKAVEVARVFAEAGETVYRIGHLRERVGEEPRAIIKGALGSLA
jgi:phosphoribosylformylglycinamidine cyclo-ligase